MKCPHCGAELAPGSKFCEHCGTPVTGRANGNLRQGMAPRLEPVRPSVSQTAGERNKIIIAGIAALVILGIGLGMFIHSNLQEKPAVATTQPAEAKEEPAPAEPAPPAPKEAPQDMLAQANSILQGRNTPSLQAVSRIDDDGFMGLYTGKQKQFIIYDQRDDLVAVVPWQPALLHPGANSNSSDKALQFKLYVLRDNRQNKDAAAGYWQGSTHVIPIQAYTKVENGKLIPLGIYTYEGSQPAPFKEYLYEQQNVNLVNTLLTHADSLRQDMQQRGITP